MPQIVSFIIQKGGCGKTTTTVNTAAYLAQQNYRVLAVDMDPQGNLTQHFGYDNENLDKTILHLFQGKTSFQEVVLKRSPNLHVLPNNLETAAAELPLYHTLSREYLLRDALTPVMHDYDFIFIDCPPALGLFSINALAASTEFILVVAPEFFPMKAIRPLYETYRMVKSKLNQTLTFKGVVMTMCDFRTRHSQDIYKILQKNFAGKLYKSFIRSNVTLKEASSVGQSIFEYAPYSVGAFDYQSFAEEFIRDHQLNKKKRSYYQKRFESLSPEEQDQIMEISKKQLSNYNQGRLLENPDSDLLKQFLLTERNKILEKLFPYRSHQTIETT
ncbi:MAG: AAA family ATPase [Calditrichia bacterium]